MDYHHIKPPLFIISMSDAIVVKLIQKKVKRRKELWISKDQYAITTQK